MMGTSLLIISFFVFLQLLATLAHARTLPEDNLEMPSSSTLSPESSSFNRMILRIIQIKRPPEPSPSPPYTPPGPQQTCKLYICFYATEDSVLNALRQNGNLEMPSSNTLSPERSSFNRMILRIIQIKRAPEPPPPPPYTPPGPQQTTRPFPPLPECFYSNLLSYITGSSTSPCHGKISSSPASSSLAHHLCNRFGNRMDLKRPVVSPPPSPLRPSPPRTALAYHHADDTRKSYYGSRIESNAFEKRQLQKGLMSSREY